VRTVVFVYLFYNDSYHVFLFKGFRNQEALSRRHRGPCQFSISITFTEHGPPERFMLLVQTQSVSSPSSLLSIKLSSLSNLKSSSSSLYLPQMSPPHPPTPTRRSARQKLRRSTGVRAEERTIGSSARSMKSQRVEEEPIASTSYSQPASPGTKKRKSPPAVQGKRGRRKVQAVGMQTSIASTSNLVYFIPGYSITYS
jgi:hypothetical protein